MKNHNAEGPHRDDHKKTNPRPPRSFHPDTLKEFHPGSLPVQANCCIMSAIMRRCPDKDVTSGHYMIPSISRDNSNGFYISTYDQFRAPFYDPMRGKDRSADSEIIDQILAGQPHRIQCAIDPDGAPEIFTYGPLMLSESVDPLEAAPELPKLEVRPARWAPESTVDEIVEGVTRDLLDCAALYAARIKVATGHRPDSESIDQLRKLTTIIRNAQKIMKSDRPVNRGGRPRKKGLPDTIRVTTLKLEMAEKNKKYANRKNAGLTPEESTPEVVKTSARPEVSNPSKINAGTR